MVERQGRKCFEDFRAVGARVDEAGEQHVAGDTADQVEIADPAH